MLRCRLHKLIVLLLVTGMILPALGVGAHCCAAAPHDASEQAAAETGSCGGCCSREADPAEDATPVSDDDPADTPGDCECPLCGCCAVQPVLYRPRPSAGVVTPLGTCLFEWTCDGTPREDGDDLLRPPRA